MGHRGSTVCGEGVVQKVSRNRPKLAMDTKWEEGLWLGHTRSSNEVFVGNKDGIVKAWAIRRRLLEERWDDAMVLSLKATPSGWSTEDAIQHEHPIETEEDGEPSSEEEEESKYSHEVRLRIGDFKRHGLTTERPGCIRIRRGAKPPYRHNDVCKKRMYDVIQREEPDRWRRHLVRRHVVSEAPHPEMKVEPIDTEARRDAWGFPSVASRLSECGGACASHEEVYQQGQPSELIDQFLKVDVVEAYSPPRVTLEAKKFGLKQGEAWDLTNGWNFNLKAHQDAAWKYIEKEKPLFIYIKYLFL